MIKDKSKTLPKVKDVGPAMDRVDPDAAAKALGAALFSPKPPNGRWPVVIHRKRKKQEK